MFAISSSSQLKIVHALINSIKNFDFQANTRLVSLETSQFRVLKRIERKGPLHYTQGLLFKNANTLIESAGIYGESGIHLIDLDDLHSKSSSNLSRDFFGEGCTMIPTDSGNNEIYQLTWRERKIFVYDAETLEAKKTLELPQPIKEGWGLTHKVIDGQTKLFITDGSNQVFVLDPKTMHIDKTIDVKDNEEKINHLNELEFFGNVLLANVYLTNKIVAINIDNGKVIRNIDCTVLVDEVRNSKVFKDNYFDGSFCLNGIAYHPETNALIITGKKWPYAYQIELKESF